MVKYWFYKVNFQESSERLMYFGKNHKVMNNTYEPKSEKYSPLTKKQEEAIKKLVEDVINGTED